MDAYVCLSEFMRNLHIRLLLGADRICGDIKLAPAMYDEGGSPQS